MSKITNNASIHEEKVDINRSAIQHRATWMGLIYKEALEAGIDPETLEGIFRRAIRKCGHFHGAGYKAQCANPADVRDFAKAFLPELGQKTFEMQVQEPQEEELKIDFHYCALLEAWQKQGIDDETCAKLCDIAMEGDRGIADAMGLNLELTDTLAQGCATCKLRFHK